MYALPGVREEALHEVLADLKYALLDFEVGLNPAFFERSESLGKGRRADPTEQHVLRATASLAMQWLMDAGDKRPVAARRVARRFQEQGWEMRGRDKTIKPENVARWRERVKSGSPAKDLETNLYRHLKEKSLASGDALESRAMKLLDWLGSRYKPRRNISN